MKRFLIIILVLSCMINLIPMSVFSVEADTEIQYIDRLNWTVSSNRCYYGWNAQRTIDGILTNDSALKIDSAGAGDWVLVDMGDVYPIEAVVLETAEYTAMNHFKMYLANTPFTKTPSEMLNSGNEEVSFEGTTDNVTAETVTNYLNINPQKARYILMVIYEDTEQFINLGEINVVKHDSRLDRSGWGISASRSFYNWTADLAFDGVISNDSSLKISGVKRGDRIDIDMKKLYSIESLEFITAQYTPMHCFNVYLLENAFEDEGTMQLDWVTPDIVYEGNSSEKYSTLVFLNNPKSARFIRIVFSEDIEGFVNLSELYVHEAIPEADSVRRTNWFARKDVYGVDGPSIPIASVCNGGISNSRSWDDVINDVDVNKIADEVEETGASYLLTSLGWGYFGIPLEPYERALGVGRGVYTSHRDTLRELIDALKKRNIKVMLYWTGDVGYQCPEPLASSRFTEEYYNAWFECTRWVSEKYGEDICGWWVDGCHVEELNDERLERFSQALRAGNPEAAICFNAGIGVSTGSVYKNTADYTSGEIAGFSVDEKRYVNGIQRHQYLPMSYQYAEHASIFSNKKFIEHYNKLKENNVMVTFGLGSTGLWNGYTSSIQMRQLRMLRDTINRGTEFNPYSTLSKPYGNIEAENCTDMKASVTDSTYSFMSNYGLLQSYDTDGDFDSSGIFYQSKSKNTFLRFDKINLKKGAIKFQANVRNSKYRIISQDETKEELPDTKMEIRIGGIDGEVIAAFEHVNEIDNFKFISTANESNIRKGIYDFETVSADVSLDPGEYDLWITFTSYDNEKDSENIDSYMTVSESDDWGYVEIANKYKQKWMYNMAISQAYANPDDKERRQIIDALSELRAEFDSNSKPIPADKNIYVQDYDRRSENSGFNDKTLELVKDPNSNARGFYLQHIYRNSFIKYNKVNFGNGTDTVYANVVVGEGFGNGKIEFYIDSINEANKIGTLTVQEGNSWTEFKEQSTNILPTNGIHDLYLVFMPKRYTVGNFEYIRFNSFKNDVSATVVMKKNSQIINNLESGSITALISTKSNLSKPYNVKLLCAVYDENMRMIQISDASATSSGNYTMELDIPENAKSIKFFAMDINESFHQIYCMNRS